MTLTEWFLFFIAVQVVHFLGTWKLYIKAGRRPFEAIIPVYNAVVLMQIINRPKWWVILLFIPVINLLIFPVIWVEISRSFGKNSNIDTLLSFLTLGFYIYYINYISEVYYVKNRSLKPKSEIGEWLSSIIFAIVAATMVHTYIMQPYTIPTSSLEKSLLVGDFLFVSKFHYGAKTPVSPISIPMVHDTIPLIGVRSYLKKPQLPYFRLPGFQKIKRNEIVVFNWPADTVNAFHQFSDGKYYYKPIDKRSNYVKRCVAIAGDSLEIRDGDIYINGKYSEMPKRAKPQFSYIVDTKGRGLSENIIYNRYNVRREGEAKISYKNYEIPVYYEKQLYEKYGNGYLKNRKYILNLDEENAKKLKNNPVVKSIKRRIRPKGEGNFVFPSIKLSWNEDNFGPIYIPEKGKTVSLTNETLPFYKRIITEYEQNTLVQKDSLIFINGKQTTDYTFKQNYYWMMGDNRHNSEDSRYWGYVPFDHVVGKPVFVWFSWDTHGKGLGKIRWNRLFTTVHGNTPAKSYFYHFLGIIFLYIIIKQFKKRKKTE